MLSHIFFSKCHKYNSEDLSYCRACAIYADKLEPVTVILAKNRLAMSEINFFTIIWVIQII